MFQSLWFHASKLDYWLPFLVVEVRRQDKEDIHPNWLFNLPAGIQRFIRQEHQWINLLSTFVANMLQISVWLMFIFVILFFYVCILLLVNRVACPVYLFHDLRSAPMFRHSVWSAIIADTLCSEAWPLITDDDVHVTLGWSELMGGWWNIYGAKNRSWNNLW